MRAIRLLIAYKKLWKPNFTQKRLVFWFFRSPLESETSLIQKTAKKLLPIFLCLLNIHTRSFFVQISFYHNTQKIRKKKL